LAAIYTGDLTYAGSASPAATFTIGKAYASVTYLATPSTVNINQTTTLTAQVEGQGGIPSAPTGTVTFLIDGNPASGAIAYTTNSNDLFATLPYTASSAGAHSLAVNYSGDSTYLPRSSTGETLTVIGPTFSVAAGPAVLTISAPGQSASTTLTLTSQNGLTGSGALSSSTCGTSSAEEIICTLSAFTLPANGTAQATLTFSSTAATATAPNSPSKPFAPGNNAPKTFLFAILSGLAALAFANRRRKDSRWNLVFGTLIFAILVTSVSCGGGGNSSSGGGGGGTQSNPGTPVGAVQPLTVSITVNGVTKTVSNLTITVQ
jgi:hypothetical protein